MCIDTPSAAVIVQPLGDGLDLAQALQLLAKFTELDQYRPELETNVAGLLQRGWALWQRLENSERLLEPGAGLVQRRPRGCFESGLPEIGHRPLSELALERVVREPLGLLTQTIGIAALDRLDDPRVERAAAVVEQAAVRDLVGQRVLE